MRKKKNYYNKRIKKKKAKYFTISSIIKFFLYIYLVKRTFSIMFKPHKNISTKKEEKKKLNKTTNYNYNYIYNYTVKLLERDQALDSGLPFLKKCIDNILIDNKTYEKVDNPKISVVIPCYNCEPYIRMALRSVQNQDMKDIEIIIVDDKSNNETVNLLNELKKEEPRLEVYHNKNNMKILYSRCFGVLQAKGKYVITLDQDDMFFDSDVFDSLFVTAEIGNYDILSYRSFVGFDYYDRSRIKESCFNYKENNLTIYQPELSCYVISTKGEPQENEIYIWDKLFRTSVYQSAINLLGEKEYSKPLTWNEDIIMDFIISNVATSYRFLRKYGYFHRVGRASAGTGTPHDVIIYADLFKLNIYLDFAKKDCYNTPALYLLKNAGYIKRVNNDEGKQFLRTVLLKIINSQHISDKNKIEVENNFKDYLPEVNNLTHVATTI